MSVLKGYYLNLDRSRERNEAMRAHLSALGLGDAYERFSAIDGSSVCADYETPCTPGALGCWLSHLELMRMNREGDAHLHIIEDDTILHPLLRRFLLESGILEQEGGWDLIFTDTYCLPTLKGLRILEAYGNASGEPPPISLVPLDATHFEFFCSTSSYIVNKASVAKYHQLLHEGWRVKDVDVFTSDLISSGKLKAFITAPFLSTLGESALTSTINPVERGDSTAARNLDVMTLHRMAYYIDADHAAIKERMGQCALPLPPSPHAEIWGTYLSYHLSLLRLSNARMNRGESIDAVNR
jgi:GR25 family glycosyltransferase involved in LPS biosynthesis